MGVRLRSSHGGCGRPAIRRASSPSPANRHVRRLPRCRTPGFSFGQMRTFAWVYSAARATEPASGRTSPSYHLHQERPHLYRASSQSAHRYKLRPWRAPRVGRFWTLPRAGQPLTYAHRPLSHPGSGPRLVHNPSAPSGPQRSPAMHLGAGRSWDPVDTRLDAEPERKRSLCFHQSQGTSRWQGLGGGHAVLRMARNRLVREGFVARQVHEPSRGADHGFASRAPPPPPPIKPC
jgi:hypothetical protein